MSASDTPPFSLIVTGDVVIDHHLYKGERETPTTDHKPGVREWREPGGAAVLANLLKAVFARAQDASWDIRLGITTPAPDENPCAHHAYAFWSPHLKSRDEQDKKPDRQEKVWRTELAMGYGHTEFNAGDPNQKPASSSPHLAQPLPDLPKPNILVLDDAGFVFRHPARSDCWLLPADGDTAAPWIVLKMSQPVAQGDLWHEVSRFTGRMVCVVSAHELRQECVNISRGLSWERTVEEVRDALLNNPTLAPLAKCRHLIVRFSDDGALWLDNTDAADPKATLVFDAAGTEGGWEDNHAGIVFGSSATFTAGIAYGLARSLAAEGGKLDLMAAIKAGLAAVRNLLEYGHGPYGKDLPRGFPVERLAGVIAVAEAKFAHADVPWPKPGNALSNSGHPWMIVEASQRPAELTILPPLVGLARQVVLRGKTALAPYPLARFGKLDTIDRFEIETLRSLRRLMVAYDDKGRAEKPLSIGVFGPPGAGKSFGVKQIAEEVFGAKAWLEFNLSQFNGPVDLIGAFHQVRDKALSGVTPVVFWDEFNSKAYMWLQYLLAPMQDGRFQEGQVNHWIGKCVFVFAGGTSSTFGEFGPPQDAADDVKRQYRLSKGPDFHSRLDAYYNVVGPNRRALPRTQARTNEAPEPDPADVCFPLRRALLIRSMLGCKGDERLDFNSDLLDALLLVPEFKHGARSLEKVITELRRNDGGPIRRSALPAAASLAMHVDAKAFDALLRRNDDFLMSEEIDRLASKIYEFFRQLSQKEGWRMQEHLDKPYDELAPIWQEDNRAAARRIPRTLSLVGLGLAKPAEPASADEPSAEFLESYLEFHLELLAEAEHDGWMEQRLANSWRLGKPRDDKARIYPLLIRYCDLPEKEKDKDRDTIRHIPEIVALAGYRIVWLRS